MNEKYVVAEGIVIADKNGKPRTVLGTGDDGTPFLT